MVKYISPVNILFVPKTSSRRLQDVFKTCLQDGFKTCLQDVFKTCLQDVFKTYLQDVFSVTSFCLPRRLQDVIKTSSRHLQDVLEDEKLLR